MQDYIYKDVLIYVLKKLGRKKLADLAKYPEYTKILENYIHHKKKFINDKSLINFIDYFVEG